MRSLPAAERTLPLGRSSATAWWSRSDASGGSCVHAPPCKSSGVRVRPGGFLPSPSTITSPVGRITALHSDRAIVSGGSAVGAGEAVHEKPFGQAPVPAAAAWLHSTLVVGTALVPFQ